MGTFVDIIELFATGFGSFFLVALVIWELYAPRLLDKDTALAPIVDEVPEKVEKLGESQERIEENVNHLDTRVEHMQNHQEKLTNVTIAQSRMMNGHEGHIDVDSVEERLTNDEDKTPDDYLTDDE